MRTKYLDEEIDFLNKLAANKDLSEHGKNKLAEFILIKKMLSKKITE